MTCNPATDPTFSGEEVQLILDNLDKYTSDEVAEIERMVDELTTRKYNTEAYDDLIEFCKRMQSDYIVGKHHRRDKDCCHAPAFHSTGHVPVELGSWYGHDEVPVESTSREVRGPIVLFAEGTSH